jgi:hypothetical protein
LPLQKKCEECEGKLRNKDVTAGGKGLYADDYMLVRPDGSGRTHHWGVCWHPIDKRRLLLRFVFICIEMSQVQSNSDKPTGSQQSKRMLHPMKATLFTFFVMDTS